MVTLSRLAAAELNNPEFQGGIDPLELLVESAQRDTGQSQPVASFLLAWWKAANCGGFDLTDIWSADAEIGGAMLVVIGLIRQSRAYPDSLSTKIHEQLKGAAFHLTPWHR